MKVYTCVCWGNFLIKVYYVQWRRRSEKTKDGKWFHECTENSTPSADEWNRNLQPLKIVARGDNEHIKQIWMINNKNTIRILICLNINGAINREAIAVPFKVHDAQRRCLPEFNLKSFRDRLVLVTCTVQKWKIIFYLNITDESSLMLLQSLCKHNLHPLFIEQFFYSAWFQIDSQVLVHYNARNLDGKSRKHVDVLYLHDAFEKTQRRRGMERLENRESCKDNKVKRSRRVHGCVIEQSFGKFNTCRCLL